MTKHCQWFELTIRLFSSMLVEIVNQRMEQTSIVILRSVFTLEFIAGMTGINEVVNIVRAILRLRPKMVKSEFRTDLRFRRTAVAATKRIHCANNAFRSCSDHRDAATAEVRSASSVRRFRKSSRRCDGVFCSASWPASKRSNTAEYRPIKSSNSAACASKVSRFCRICSVDCASRTSNSSRVIVGSVIKLCPHHKQQYRFPAPAPPVAVALPVPAKHTV